MFSSLSDIPDENQAILLIENWPTTGSKSDIAILRQLSWGRNTIQAGGTPRSEHLRPDYSWNPGRNRLFSDASRIDLGLDQLGTPTKTTNCPSDSVADRICFCNRFGRPSRFVGRVCSGSPLSVLRPLLLRIFRWGGLLSLAGILFGICGVWRPGPLRWQAPVCGLGTLAFWLLAAEGE
jgi:hypothetical protein